MYNVHRNFTHRIIHLRIKKIHLHKSLTCASSSKNNTCYHNFLYWSNTHAHVHTLQKNHIISSGSINLFLYEFFLFWLEKTLNGSKMLFNLIGKIDLDSIIVVGGSKINCRNDQNTHLKWAKNIVFEYTKN